ncbi:MAG: hypothetical protein ACREQV_23295 [Candidatus Binatia bacterium]
MPTDLVARQRMVVSVVAPEDPVKGLRGHAVQERRGRLHGGRPGNDAGRLLIRGCIESSKEAGDQF